MAGPSFKPSQYEKLSKGQKTIYWDEGGKYRTELHIAGGALIGGLGGGSAFDAIGGAAGAGLAAKMADQLEQISKGVGSATGSELLGNLAANVAAGVGGVLVGGTAGAATGSAVQLYNQGMDKKKKDLVSQVCGAGAQCSDATLNAAIQAQGANADAAAGTLQPNYVSVGITTLSGSGNVTANLYDGSTYMSGGAAIANPSSVQWSPGGAVTFGWIFGAKDAQSTHDFIAGDGNQAYISVPTPLKFNVNAAITHSYGGSTAIELGVGSTGDLSYGVIPWSHATQVSQPIY